SSRCLTCSMRSGSLSSGLPFRQIIPKLHALHQASVRRRSDSTGKVAAGCSALLTLIEVGFTMGVLLQRGIENRRRPLHIPTDQLEVQDEYRVEDGNEEQRDERRQGQA